MSPFAYLSNDHSPGIGSPSSELLFFRSNVVSSLCFAVSSHRSIAANPASWFEFPTGLNLVVDLSSCLLQ
jgi:hypothetical protein